MIIEIVAESVLWFHAFTHYDIISNTMSPCEIIAGMTLDYNCHCKHQYQDYVQTYDQHNSTARWELLYDPLYRTPSQSQKYHASAHAQRGH